MRIESTVLRQISKTDPQAKVEAVVALIGQQVAYCHTSAKILGYDRNRDLIWDTVTSRITKEEKECLHIWTTRGDCPLVPSTKLSTTLGAITMAKLANVVRSGEDIRVEVPRIKPVEGLVGAPTSGGVAALLRPRLLPFRCAGKPVLRVHTSSLQSCAVFGKMVSL